MDARGKARKEAAVLAYEVIKRVGGRAYRYRVESYRDRDTGRVRGKWTYVGRVDGEGTLSPDRTTRTSSRDKLLDAIDRLFDHHELSTISSGMVASEAGVAYGTFYRYFKDVDDAVRAALMRQSEPAAVLREYFTHPLGSHDQERARLECWAAAIITGALERPGLMRAWYAASNVDRTLIDMRRERANALSSALEEHISRLRSVDYAHVVDAPAAAFAVVALLEGAIRSRTVAEEPVGIPAITATVAQIAGFV